MNTSVLDGVGLTFEESMSGYLGVGEPDPKKGAALGQHRETQIRIDVKVTISDLSRFLKVSQHQAMLLGTVICEALGGTYEISDGSFNLFVTDPATGMCQMVYAFRFKDRHGQTYYLHGHKEIHHEPHKLDVLEDMTRLLVVLYEGQGPQSPIRGADEMRFRLADAPALAASMKVTNARSPWQQVAAHLAFIHFAHGVLRQKYLENVTLLYETRYENLVLSGTVHDAQGQRPFFLVSGVHDKGVSMGRWRDVLGCAAGGRRRQWPIPQVRHCRPGA